jgi:hypothetical protein
MTFTGPSASIHSSSAAAPAHLNLTTDPLNLLPNPQMGVGYLPDPMQSHTYSQSFQSQSGRSTPSACNPQTSHLAPAIQQQQQQQQFGDTWNDDIAFLTALTAANHPPSTTHHNRRQSAADIDALFLAPDAALPQASLVEAPHPDQFESELENFLASADPSERSALDAYNPVVDYTRQAFTNYRLPGTFSVPGAHSIITASSESGYDDFGSESYYNPYSPQGSLVNAANPTSLASLHFGIEDFQALNFNDPSLNFDPALDILTPISQAPPAGQNLNLNPPGSSAISLDLLTMHSSITSQQTHSSHDRGNDSDGSQRSDGSLERERKFGTIPSIPGQQYIPVQPQSLTDARKKYQCPSCPRGLYPVLLSKRFTDFALFAAFARAFNLKTHIATHDPNRLKPYVCPHKSCNRSFSRKHDLGRHLVSIHKDETGLAMTGGGGGSSARSTIGVPGHPVPNNQHSSTGRVHRVGGNDTPKHQVVSCIHSIPFGCAC